METIMKRRWAAVVIGSAVAVLVGPVGVALADPPIAASGVFTQTQNTGGGARLSGQNLILEGTTVGPITGTLSGMAESHLTVVIHPDGSFSAHGTNTCECTVQGKQGQLVLVVTDTGEMVDSLTAHFTGRWAITKASGELSGLTGNLHIEGTVNVMTGLSVVNYTGQIHPAH